MTDFYDLYERQKAQEVKMGINTGGRTWRGTLIDMDLIGSTCGRGYGFRPCDACPEDEPIKQEMGRIEKHWECYVEGSDGGRHYHHRTLTGARTEAERLASLSSNQGKTVYLFECIGKCRVEPSPVSWYVPR